MNKSHSTFAKSGETGTQRGGSVCKNMGGAIRVIGLAGRQDVYENLLKSTIDDKIEVPIIVETKYDKQVPEDVDSAIELGRKFNLIYETDQHKGVGLRAFLGKIGYADISKLADVLEINTEGVGFPDNPPKLWANRDANDTPISFIQSVYSDWIAKGLTRSWFRLRDPDLYDAYASWIKRHPKDKLPLSTQSHVPRTEDISKGKGPLFPVNRLSEEGRERVRAYKAARTREYRQRLREKQTPEKISFEKEGLTRDFARAAAVQEVRPFPEVAPKLWRDRDETTNPAKFCQDVYGYWIDRGLMTRQLLGKRDPQLYQAYAQWIRPNRHPEDDLKLPTRSEIVSDLLANADPELLRRASGLAAAKRRRLDLA